MSQSLVQLAARAGLVGDSGPIGVNSESLPAAPTEQAETTDGTPSSGQQYTYDPFLNGPNDVGQAELYSWRSPTNPSFDATRYQTLINQLNNIFTEDPSQNLSNVWSHYQYRTGKTAEFFNLRQAIGEIERTDRPFRVDTPAVESDDVYPGYGISPAALQLAKDLQANDILLAEAARAFEREAPAIQIDANQIITATPEEYQRLTTLIEQRLSALDKAYQILENRSTLIRRAMATGGMYPAEVVEAKKLLLQNSQNALNVVESMARTNLQHVLLETTLTHFGKAGALTDDQEAQRFVPRAQSAARTYNQITAFVNAIQGELGMQQVAIPPFEQAVGLNGVSPEVTRQIQSALVQGNLAGARSTLRSVLPQPQQPEVVAAERNPSAEPVAASSALAVAPTPTMQPPLPPQANSEIIVAAPVMPMPIPVAPSAISLLPVEEIDSSLLPPEPASSDSDPVSQPSSEVVLAASQEQSRALISRPTPIPNNRPGNVTLVPHGRWEYNAA